MKSSRALQWTILQLRYLLLGSKFSWLNSLAVPPPATDDFSSFLISKALTLALKLSCVFLTGILYIISLRIPSDFSFSISWFLSRLANLGSLATAVFNESKNLCFSK